MNTPISLFDYDLPERFIAQSSVEPRDHSKLMVVDRATGEVQHKQFFNIIEELKAGDVLVFNTSKVFKARLLKEGLEIFVLRIKEGEAEVLLKPGRKFREGDVINVAAHEFIVQEKSTDGVVILRTGMTAAEMLVFCDKYGDIPTPPYVEGSLKDESKYQTIYAKQVGSVAAPTAGFHFTPELLEKIKAKGVQIEEVVLHVGIGTFRPVKTETLEEHEMHSEWVSLSKETAERINAAKSEGRRVIAVGTTTTRVLEGIASTRGSLVGYEGEINIFITPGFEFKVIDGLITNFHLPKSTLLVLVSSFSSRERMLAAYEAAKTNDYRFFSFGDAMFIR
ncbi:MAG: tRNA preQ1(34) S-adenosylmethionine ribosyltransferase-isomerase QueA [Patescibacteria group bacterium]|jgi:S-adenosylmethionine:tRNA ribosyltransferase-isomerase